MNESAITVRYAKALYQVGEETGNVENIKADVEILNQAVKESPEFVELLQSPIIKTSEKIRLFNEIFSGTLDSVVINFFTLLSQNKREQYLPLIFLNFLQFYNQKKGIKEAIITTAQPLKDVHREGILELLKKKFKLNIKLNERVNEDIIGGFRLRIEDQQIDASISSKLRKVKQELINS